MRHNHTDLLRYVSLTTSRLRIDIIKSSQEALPQSVRIGLYPLLPLLLFAYALIPLRPLFLRHDDLSDIPLTPKQRSLLGLRPTSQPATPGSHYVTPPRYSRSGTPRSTSSSQSGSPFSGTGSPLASGAAIGYSPSASPLFQKAIGRDATRRMSLGSPSPLSLGRESSNNSLTSIPSPSPLTGKGAIVGLNNRWLYERGRRSSSGLRTPYL